MAVTPGDEPLPEGATLTAAGDEPLPVGATLVAGPTANPVVDEINQTGRAAGLGYRGIVTGAAGIPQAAMDVLSSVNALDPHSALSRAFTVHVLRQPDPGPSPDAAPTTAEPYAPKPSDFVHPEKWQQFAEWAADKVGLPKPTTDADKVLYKGAQAVPYALTTPEALIPGALSAFAGGAASEATRQAGGGALAQVGAGLAAGGVAGLAAGAEGGAARGIGATQAAIDDAAASGTALTAGQATGSRTLQWAENAVGSLPGGSGIMERSAATQRAGLSDSLDHIISNLSGGQDATPTTAGNAVEAGGRNAIAQLHADANTAYGAVDSLVPPDTGINLSNTNNLLQRLTAPTPGAEATTGSLISPKLKELATNLQADMHNAGDLVSPFIPYSTTRALKSALGEYIDWSPFPTDPVNGQLKLVYNALRDDINNGASAVSPEAEQAVKAADAQYAAGRTKLGQLQGIIGKDGKAPEAIFNAALNGTGPNGGATIVSRALEGMNTEQKNLFAGAVLKRMGTASPGLQGAEGGAFNGDQFLTNWNKMNPEAKSAIFDSIPGGYRQNLDAFARTVDRLKQSGRVLSNPSGTATKLLAGGLLTELIGSVPTMFVAPKVGIAALAGGVGTAVAANIGARVLTSPAAVRWLAQQSKMPGGLANILSQSQKVVGPAPQTQDTAATQ